MEILNVQNLSFSYGSGAVLRHVSFRLNKGDFAMLKGGNGSGKSTLMKLILHEIQPQEGSIHLFGETAAQVDWTRVAYLEQNAISRNQHFPATAREILSAYLYARRKHEKLKQAEVKQLIDEALAAVDMQGYANRLIGELSGGQQQRMMLAALLAADVRLMCLDEPTAGMDWESSAKLYRLLQRLQRERQLTILMITHDLEMISDFASRVFCLERGSLVELSEQEVRQASGSHQHQQHCACHADHRDLLEEA